MTNPFFQIYAQQAAEYHELITPEDVDNNLLTALEQVVSFHGKRVLDLGTGTGRFPLLLGQRPAQLIGLDLHAAMLQENKLQRNKLAGDWALTQGDMRVLPLASGWADIVMSGWAIGHLNENWLGAEWQLHVGRVLAEMHRVVQPKGTIIIAETLTTGSPIPAPPHQALAKYYAWLEDGWGFTRQEVSTDFQFATVDQAAESLAFFFGPAMADKIRQNNWSRVPEWTGVWSKKL